MRENGKGGVSSSSPSGPIGATRIIKNLPPQEWYHLEDKNCVSQNCFEHHRELANRLLIGIKGCWDHLLLMFARRVCRGYVGPLA